MKFPLFYEMQISEPDRNLPPELVMQSIRNFGEKVLPDFAWAVTT